MFYKVQNAFYHTRKRNRIDSYNYMRANQSSPLHNRAGEVTKTLNSLLFTQDIGNLGIVTPELRCKNRCIVALTVTKGVGGTT